MLTSQNIQRPKNSQQGFSLIELLVVCVIISFLGTVLYATFYQGVNLWKRAQADRGEYRDIFFVERLTQDLRNAFPLSGSKIKGTAKEFEFYALLSGGDLGLSHVASGLRFPCRVRYYFDASNQQVSREVQSYSQILTESKEKIKTNIVFQTPKNMEWMFMGRTKAAVLLWQKVWEKDYLPNAVKLRVEYDDQKQVFIRTINIPGGGQHERLPSMV